MGANRTDYMNFGSVNTNKSCTRPMVLVLEIQSQSLNSDRESLVFSFILIILEACLSMYLYLLNSQVVRPLTTGIRSTQKGSKQTSI